MTLLDRVLSGTSLSWASDAAVPSTGRPVAPVLAVPPHGGRRNRDMGSPPTPRAATPVVSPRPGCTPVTEGGRAGVGAAAVARLVAGLPGGVALLARRFADGGRPGFGSSRDRQLGEQPGPAAHT